MIDYLLHRAKIHFSLRQKRTDYGYGGYGDREDYYQNLFTDRSISSLLHWVSLKEEAVCNPHIQLAFRGIHFGASKKDMHKKLGKPRFIIQNPQLAQHEVFFYRFSINRLHSIAALHFLENEFFMASHTFKQISTKNYQRVLEALTSKYGVMLTDCETAVKDPQNHLVSVNPGLYLSVRYVSGQPHIADCLTQLLKEKESIKQLQEKKGQAIISEFL